MVRPGRGVNLQRERLSRAYRSRLEFAGAGFAAWCRERGLELRALVQDKDQMNEALIAHVQDLFKFGKALWHATHAVLAVQTACRQLRGSLRGAWDSILAWRFREPVRSRTPLPRLLMEAFCRYGAFAAMSHGAESQLIWWNFCVVLRTGFFALLRPKELFGLRVKELRLPHQWSLLSEHIAVATILSPKNRAHSGRLQVRIVRDPACVDWLLWMTRDFSPETPLWLFSPRRFKLCLDEAADFLQVRHLRLTPASLRAGGATALLEAGVPASEIKMAGGWSSDRALGCYLQEAEAAAALLDVPVKSAVRLKKFLARLNFARLPPSVPFSTLA